MSEKKQSKRGAKGNGTIRQRPDGRWEARYTIGKDPGTGRQIQRSIYASSQKEVRKKLSEIVVKIDKNTYVQPDRTTVGQWLDKWLKMKKDEVTDGTYKKYETDIRCNIKPNIGAILLQDLSYSDVKTMMNKLSKNHSQKSLMCIKGTLSGAIREAIRDKVLVSNPCEEVKISKRGKAKREITPLSKEQLEQFLSLIHGSEYEYLFIVAFFVGLREGEIQGLQWKCVDFENNTLIIDKQLKRKNGGVYYLDETKTHTKRKLKVPPAVMDALRKQKAIQKENKLLVGSQWDNGGIDDLVFTNSTGMHHGKNTLYHVAQRYAEKVGVKNFRFHDCRHTFAVHYYLAGNDIFAVSRALGHSSIKLTADTYMSYIEELQDQGRDNMKTYMEGLSVGVA